MFSRSNLEYVNPLNMEETTEKIEFKISKLCVKNEKVVVGLRHNIYYLENELDFINEYTEKDYINKAVENLKENIENYKKSKQENNVRIGDSIYI
jgi:hypothetical protein